jgi:hypothetical protein
MMHVILLSDKVFCLISSLERFANFISLHSIAVGRCLWSCRMPPLLGRFGARRTNMPDHPTTVCVFVINVPVFAYFV